MTKFEVDHDKKIGFSTCSLDFNYRQKHKYFIIKL